MNLTAEQARALWEAGGFAVLKGLPEGSETGIDGTFHTTKSFSGLKFVPPGLHVLTWSLPGSMMRNGLVRFWGAKERVVLDIEGTEGSVDEAELRSLDPQLAPYPFARLEEWKKLTGHITPAIVTRVLGDGRIDGMTQVEGEKDELSAAVEEAKRALKKSGVNPTPTSLSGENSGRKMVFPTFDLKRSWKEGATGDEVTRWSRDKSQLWAKVCTETGGPSAALGTLELAFVLITEVWSFAALGAYKRLLTLFCRSAVAVARPEELGDEIDFGKDARQTFVALIEVLAAQISTLPESAFTTELPDMDTFYLAEIEQLGKNLGAALAEPQWWGEVKRVGAAWEKLDRAATGRGWKLQPLAAGDEDDELEEGEDAPVVVDL